MIGLYDIAKLMTEGWEKITILSCDVIELNILAGEPVHITGEKKLAGVSRHNGQSLQIYADVGYVQGHVLPNGVLELHPRRPTEGIDPCEGVWTSRKSKEAREGICAIVDGKLHLWMGDRWLSDVQDSWFAFALSSHTCLHSFEAYGSTGFGENTTIIERCRLCDEERTRPAKTEEQMNIDDLFNTGIHRTYREFEDLVDHEPCEPVELEGYENILIAEEFAQEHPRDVQIVRVDDAAHAGSRLLLINHETLDHFMGTTVCYIPQCHGNGAEFFLYKQDRRALMRALELIEKQEAAHGEDDDE